MLATSDTNIADPAVRRERDIELLMSLRQQVLDQVVDAKALSMDLSREFNKVLDVINHDLAYALLAQKTEEAPRDLEWTRLPNGSLALLRPEAS